MDDENFSRIKQVIPLPGINGDHLKNQSMKNFKNGILAIALMAGVLGAFATKAAQSSKRGDPIYNWSSSNVAPDNPNQTNYDDTVSGAELHFGCTTGSTLCASGNKISGSGAATATLDVTP
jgi:hypothetical protein